MAEYAVWLEAATAQVRQAAAERRVLRIRGGGSKDFYGDATAGEVLDTRGCCGIVDYRPRELTLTARAGTPLAEIEQALAQHGQMLPFEPPHFGPGATLGGCVAAGLSGPRRPYAGAVRDAVLGVRLLDGQGRQLRFGGSVIKNVAGYDVSRLMVGALGTLGVLLEVSLKVLPRPECERTLTLQLPQQEAILTMNRWAGQPLPLSATCWLDGCLQVRLSGSESAVAVAAQKIGGEALAQAGDFWQSLREQRLPPFAAPPLWRMALPAPSPPLPLATAAVEWGGGVRWCAGEHAPQQMHALAAGLGGHATLFRGAAPGRSAFAPLPPAQAALQQRIRRALDPQGVFASGRMGS